MYKKLASSLKGNAGFSLIELVIVVTILAVIAVVGFQVVGTGAIAKSKASADLANAELIAKSIDSAIQEDRLVLAADVGTAATAVTITDATAEGLVLIGTNTGNALNPAKVYMQKIPTTQRVAGGFFIHINKTTGKIMVRAGTATGSILFPRQDNYNGDANYTVLDK